MKVYFLNLNNNPNAFCGPTQVFNKLVNNIKSRYNNAEVITNETVKGDFFKAILSLVLKDKEEKSFLINGEGLKLPMFMYLVSKIFRKNNYFLLYHGLRVVEDKFENRNKKIYYILEKFLLRNYENLICVSNFHKNLVVKTVGRSKPTHVIYNGVEDNIVSNSKKQSDKEEIQIVMSGGVKEIKGIKETIDFVKTFNSKESLKIKLNIFGNYTDEEYYALIMNSIKDDEYINYGGIVAKEELYKWYEKSDFLIALSKFDSFNMSILEALATGTPVICSENVGAGELIEDYKTGIVVKKNYKKMRDFVIETFANCEIYSIMITECKLLYKKNSVKKMQDIYIDILTTSMKGR